MYYFLRRDEKFSTLNIQDICHVVSKKNPYLKFRNRRKKASKNGRFTPVFQCSRRLPPVETTLYLSFSSMLLSRLLTS